MATLKISTVSTYWITGVKMITDLGGFSVTRAGFESLDQQLDAVCSAATTAGVFNGSNVVRPVEWFGSEDEGPVDGMALLVEREAQYHSLSQIWLVPRRSVFMLSDSGSTIDRI